MNRIKSCNVFMLTGNGHWTVKVFAEWNYLKSISTRILYAYKCNKKCSWNVTCGILKNNCLCNSVTLAERLHFAFLTCCHINLTILTLSQIFCRILSGRICHFTAQYVVAVLKMSLTSVLFHVAFKDIPRMIVLLFTCYKYSIWRKTQSPLIHIALRENYILRRFYDSILFLSSSYKLHYTTDVL